MQVKDIMWATLVASVIASEPVSAQNRPARPSPAQSQPLRVTAARCGPAAGRDMNNVRVTCNTYNTILHRLDPIVRESQVDPMLIRLITQGAFDEALQRVAELTRRRTTNTAIYLAIAATIVSVRGTLEEATDLLRRAYEADPNNGLIVVGYYGTLAASLDHVRARQVVADAHRRRRQFDGIGRVWIDFAWMQMNHPPTVLDVWFRARASCGTASVPPTQNRSNGSAEVPTGSSCPLDSVASRNVAALRDEATTLVREAAAAQAGHGSATQLQMQYYGWQYVLLCDLLLGDTAAAARTGAAMDEILAQLRTRFGPWALLAILAVSHDLDQITPLPYLQRKYDLSDAALQDAAGAPMSALARFVSDDRLLPQHNELMLASHRLFVVRAALRLQRYPVAWAGALRAIEEARTFENFPLAIQVQAQAVSLMAEIAGNTRPDFDRGRLRFEYERLRASYSQDPRLWRSVPGVLEYLQGQLCEIEAMSGDECRPVTPPAVR